MDTLIHAAISPPPQFFKLNTANRKSAKARAVRRLGKNERVNSMFSRSSQMGFDGHDNMEMLQSSNSRLETKHSDIWKHFRDAQRNILYLNKQRLLAIEELNKAKEENQFLLDKIDQLEVEKDARVDKGPPAKLDEQSIFCELLLRIDSMVLTGVISTEEGSDLRRQVMDNKFSIAAAFSHIQQKGDAELLTELRHFLDKSKRNCFHIVHICTEMAPVVSVGSLGSYVTGLSLALQRKGNLVEVILPKYTSLEIDKVEGLRKIEAEFYSYFNGQLHGNRVWTGIVSGIGVTFIEPLHYAFFNREVIYGYSDDFERFTYFSRASLDYIIKSGKQPDVLHIHNWETAIVGPLFWDIFVNQGLRGTRILLTCHGFNSQCLEEPDKLALCGLDPSRLHRPDRLQDNIKAHLVNILKGGVVYSNKVIIMSSVHSKGRIIRSLSHGLESTLAIHKEKLLIAPYGLDTTIWDPSKDPFLPKKISSDDVKGKAICKVALRHHLGLSGLASMIIIGCIYSEFSDVGLENLKEAAWLASRKGAQFILMGASNTPSINKALEKFQKELKDEHIRFIKNYDEALEHLIFAGSDIILCPSFRDPVLQLPLKAIKYGAAPVAIGLNDDGFKRTFQHDLESTRTSEYIASTFANMSLSQALDQIQNNPSQWNRKIKDAMAMDFSWEAECCDIHHTAYTSIKNL